MAIANLAMATGNIGRQGVGVNPLRGQNNVQGSCDMGSFPHELPGYRHISDDAMRDQFENMWGVQLDSEPGLRIPNMFDAAIDGTFKGIYVQGEDILQSDPNTQHVTGGAGGDGMRRRPGPVPERDRELRPCLPAGLDLPGEGRHLHQCRTPHQPRAQGHDAEERHGRLGNHHGLAKAMGFEMHYDHPSEIMDEIAALTPTFAGVSYDHLERTGSVQWPCNEKAPVGTPIMHIGGFARGKGNFMITEYVPTDERTGPRFPLLLTTGRILSQYNVGAQTRRTENVVWHEEDVLEIHPHDAEQRGVRDGDWVKLDSRAGDTTLRALTSPIAWRRASSTRPSTIPTRRPTSSPRSFPTGRPTARNTRSRPSRSRRPTARATGRRNMPSRPGTPAASRRRKRRSKACPARSIPPIGRSGATATLVKARA